MSKNSQDTYNQFVYHGNNDSLLRSQNNKFYFQKYHESTIQTALQMETRLYSAYDTQY